MNTITTNKTQNFFSLIRQSLRGEEMDYTTGSIRRAVFLLAVPMMLEMAMESVFAVVDLYFVGHLEHSRQAIQTVGLTESVLTIVYSLAIGMSMAATAVVARRVGEKNPEAAAHAGAQAIIISVAITLVLSITGMIYASGILSLMGGSPEVVEMGTPFVRIMMGSSMVIMLLFLINGIFRGAGNAAIAMKSLWIANLCNILLCPLLINGLGPIPAFGLTGAAIATCIGRSVGVIYQVWHLVKGNGQLKFRASHYLPDKKLILSIIRVALPGTFQFVIASCSWIILAKLVADTGNEEGSAGYQTALRLMMFFLLPAWGLSNAAATLVGQNLGAREIKRAEDSVMQTMKYNVLFMVVVTILFFTVGHLFVSFFTNDEAVRQMGVKAMRILSCGFVFYGIGMVLINSFNGAGDTWTPTAINFFGFWLFQIPFAYLLAVTANLGPVGVFIAVPVTETMITIVSFILFRKGKWKTIKV
ncbi:MAG: MATE family efflux transporter [Chitinophagaceae bacterium]